jgi:Ran GTPase-activating protein (RanGAP) involved in mRNA processing and transport
MWVKFDKGATNLASILTGDTLTITRIDLGNNKIGKKGANAIAEALKVNTNIKVIDLSSNNHIGNRVANAIKINRAITIEVAADY